MIASAVALFVLHLPWGWALPGSGNWATLASVWIPGGDHLGLADLATFTTGPIRTGWLGWAFGFVLVVALLLGSGWRLAWACRATGVVVVFVGIAWLGDRGTLDFGLARRRGHAGPRGRRRRAGRRRGRGRGRPGRRRHPTVVAPAARLARRPRRRPGPAARHRHPARRPLEAGHGRLLRLVRLLAHAAPGRRLPGAVARRSPQPPRHTVGAQRGPRLRTLPRGRPRRPRPLGPRADPGRGARRRGRRSSRPTARPAGSGVCSAR